MVLLIDNYDSFTYNLVHLVAATGRGRPQVVRNDERSIPELTALGPDAVILSPGPGRPCSAGICLAAVQAFMPRCPVLGVCLGMQCIAQALGGLVVPARRLMHGKTSVVGHDGSAMFAHLPASFRAARYHSLAVDGGSLPGALRSTAHSDDGEIMALEHRSLPTWGVQFHPESFLTEGGVQLLANFLTLAETVRGSLLVRAH